MWDEITYRFPYFNGSIGWISEAEYEFHSTLHLACA